MPPPTSADPRTPTGQSDQREWSVREHRLAAGDLRRLRDDPHRVLLDVARAGGDLAVLRLGPGRAFFPIHPHGVKQVLQDRWKSYDRHTFQYRLLSGVTGEGLLSLDGLPWLARRRSAQPAFHRSKVGAYLETMRGAALRVRERWDAAASVGREVDVLQDMSRFALEVLSETLLGSAAGTAAVRDDLVHATELVLDHVMHRSRTLGLIPEWLPTARNRRYREGREVLERIIAEAIGRARAGRDSGDLLSLLVDPSTDPPLSDRQLRDELVTFVIAGHETVASALTWTWLLLATHPHVADRVAAHDPDQALTLGPGRPRGVLIEVFNEALRLYPPAWIATRRAVAEETILGRVVPRGSLVVTSPFVTQRLATLWPDPDRFDPDRFRAEAPSDRFAFFPFGGGPHLCIGNHFALLEGVVALSVLGPRVAFRAPAQFPGTDAGVTLRPQGGLRMIPTRR